ncbi:hypothetical protein B0H67DRAFT_564526 [Lasiosphaeris hirsuta]|uniref:E3 ubiquitin-protein ligase HERC2 n=1 Tax=Lasiosphaeris hirsuta TaxID=260670 RepID=A0AA40BBQ5_9PEZI|nr:hypothetical protein B0H67DRAFT_564526 [Lasiosphaeris hirsuta]
MENTSSAAASTLTRQRASVAVLSCAVAASIGYFCYRIYNPLPPEIEPGHRIRRSNAVRHRRRSIPDIHNDHNHDHDDANPEAEGEQHQHGRQRRPSIATTTTTVDEPQTDENLDLNTVRPLTDGDITEHQMEDDWYDEPSNFPNVRAGQNIVSLLFRVSEDNARRNAYVHRGCQCNACGIVPIRGIRYRCANCADFDLCETCESQGLHTKTHIFYKIKIPAPRLGPRQMQSIWYPGDPESCLRSLPRQLIAKLSKETGFERPELEALWEQWTFMANTEWREDPDDLGLAMDRKTFERYLVPSGGYRHTAPNLLHDRIFAFYDTNNDDLVGFSEFLHGTSYRKRKDRLRKVFEGYDVDGDGYVNRRDFLRLFRAYYVLFKQMHKDIVEGLDDQVLSSTEAHQLISSRQPLSSLFGREGGFPSADPDRPIEGKVINANSGDRYLADGTDRAVAEDKTDTAERATMLMRLFNRPSHTNDSLFPLVADNRQQISAGLDTRYLSGLLNPPARVDELPALLVGEARDGDEFFVVLNNNHEHNHRQDDGSESQDDDINGDGDRFGQDENASHQAGDTEAQFAQDQPSRAEGGNLVEPDGSAAREEAENQWQAERRNTHHLATNRPTRRKARSRLLERWKRRQFYVDEEEGAFPPEGWNDEKDILANLNGIAGTSKSKEPPFLSTRSRSSSKVRFVEDTDDYDIRSNPSTSSRSIPERWGGMDIPDAEKDAGKEVFYQVIQQAFNEILDILFHSQEDLAVEAAETKALRDQHRPLFESINLDKLNHNGENITTNPNVTAESDEPTEDKPLEDLLAEGGYSVNPSAQAGVDFAAESGDGVEMSAKNGKATDGGSGETFIEGEVAVDDGSKEEIVYRDPTMPQFRPNSVSPISKSATSSFRAGVPASDNTALVKSIEEDDRSEGTDSKGKSTKPVVGSAVGAPDGGSSSQPQIPRHVLCRWKVLDQAEMQAKERGGWGRLNFEEFERIYKIEGSDGSRLDYLGTWIDFCIPYH